MEVVKIRVKKYEGLKQPEVKSFSIDPQLTSFEDLQLILSKAFSVDLTKRKFLISYHTGVVGSSGKRRFAPMLCDWDFHSAVMSGGIDSHLSLKMDLTPFDGLEDWDVIDTEDTVSPVNSVSTPIGTVSKSLISQLASRVQKSLLGSNSDKKRIVPAVQIAKGPKAPMSDAEFRSFLDPTDGRLIKSAEFRLSVYWGGVEPQLRPVVWSHLLSVYPAGMTGLDRLAYRQRLNGTYDRLKHSWQSRLKLGRVTDDMRLVANQVRKDAVRTDRQLDFYAGVDDDNSNVLSLFNILTTYALTHPDVSYCQGMSDLASPLLVVMRNEADAYVSFCALMARLKGNFLCDGHGMTRKFEHLSLLLEYYDPTLYEYLREIHADDLLFCYRWLLLELKREFAFDESLTMLEVMWASLLPSDSDANGVESAIFDVDISVELPLATVTSTTGKGPTSSAIVGVVETNKSVNKAVVVSGDNKNPSGNPPKVVSKAIEVLRGSGDKTVLSQSCPNDLCLTNSSSPQLCHSALLRSLLLDQRQFDANKFPHKTVHKWSIQLGGFDFSRGQNSFKFDIDFSSDEDSGEEEKEISLATSRQFRVSRVKSPRRKAASVSVFSDKTTEDLSAAQPANNLVAIQPQWDFDESPPTVVTPIAQKTVKASEETFVSDEFMQSGEFPPSTTKLSNSTQSSPIPVADEALADAKPTDKPSGDKDDLRLSEIHDILVNRGLHSSGSISEPSRSRHSSFDSGNDTNSNWPLSRASVTPTPPPYTCAPVSTIKSSKNRHCSGQPDSGCYSTTPLERSVEVAVATPTANCTSQPDATGTNPDEFVTVDKDPDWKGLPSPLDWTDKNPFGSFLALTLLLQHREAILKGRMDYNDICLYFDKLIRRHPVDKVLYRARILYSDYLQSGWWKKEEKK